MNKEGSSTFLDISNFMGNDNSFRGKHISRRPSDTSIGFKKQPQRKELDTGDMCYIPLQRILRSSSQIFVKNRGQQTLQASPDQKNGRIGVPFGKVPRCPAGKNEHLFKTKIEAINRTQCLEKENCLEKRGKQEKEQKNSEAWVIGQNQRLMKELSEARSLLIVAEDEIRLKNQQIKSLSSSLQQINQLRKDQLNHLSSVMKKLARCQEKEVKYEKYLNISQDWKKREKMTQIIQELTNKMKYKDIELHMLKKDRHRLEQFERKYQLLEKENKVLKERIDYYMRSSKLDLDLQSQSSLSLSMSSMSQWRATDRQDFDQDLVIDEGRPSCF